MLGFECQDLIIGLVSVLTALDIIFIGDSGLLLDFANLFLHFNNGILGEEDLLAHNVDLCLHVLIPPNGVIQVHFGICEKIVRVQALLLLLFVFFIRWYHLLDLVLFLIELGLHLLYLILKD